MMLKLIVIGLFIIFMLLILKVSFSIYGKKTNVFSDEEIDIIQRAETGNYNEDEWVPGETVLKTIRVISFLKIYRYFFISWHIFLVAGILILVFK